MSTSTYLQAMGIVVVAIASSILGKVYEIDFLSNTLAPGLLGAALGYLGHATKQMITMRPK